jgi:hypothetical protein
MAILCVGNGTSNMADVHPSRDKYMENIVNGRAFDGVKPRHL